MDIVSLTYCLAGAEESENIFRSKPLKVTGVPLRACCANGVWVEIRASALRYRVEWGLDVAVRPRVEALTGRLRRGLARWR